LTTTERIKERAEVEIPAGMIMYGFRHFFASNCLSHNIPITEVAKWMGHRSADIIFQGPPPPDARLHQPYRRRARPRPGSMHRADGR
jgi:integrase